MRALAAGLDPDAQVAAVLIEALTTDDLGDLVPRAMTAADLESAAQVVTFNLAPVELPIARASVERWDDVPAVSEDLDAARRAIRRHLERLIDDFSSSHAG
jgi:hypothetical protein